jgi:hypothetical protein
MNKRVWFFAAACVGALAVSAGVMTGLHPFESASADSAAPSGATDARIAQALNDFAPGAVVKLTEDGGFSVTGRRTDAERIAIEAMNAAEKAGPQSIRCTGGGAPLTCIPIPDSSVVAALKRGETIYGRAVKGKISADFDTTAPMFSADELICGGGSGATLSCTPVSVARPTLPAGETTFVTYRPFRVRFEGDRIIGLGDELTIPLRRASG